MFDHLWRWRSSSALPPPPQAPSRRAPDRRASRFPEVPVCANPQVQAALSARYAGPSLAHELDRSAMIVATRMISHGIDVDIVPRLHSPALSAAIALDDLGKATAAFQAHFLQRAGRLNRHDDDGMVIIQAPTGSGKTMAFMQAALDGVKRSVRRTRAFEYVSAAGDPNPFGRIVDAQQSEISTDVVTSERKCTFLLGRALGLSRSVSRQLRNLLLLLVDLRAGVLRVSLGLADAYGCSRGRVFLRTPMRGSRNPIAPPQGPQSRTLMTAGFVGSPQYT